MSYTQMIIVTSRFNARIFGCQKTLPSLPERFLKQKIDWLLQSNVRLTLRDADASTQHDYRLVPLNFRQTWHSLNWCRFRNKL